MTSSILITCPECGRVVDYTGPATAGERDCCRATVAGLESVAEDSRIGTKARFFPGLFDAVAGGLGRMAMMRDAPPAVRYDAEARKWVDVTQEINHV